MEPYLSVGYSMAEALIVVALAALAGVYLYFKHAERKRRMELIHQERLAAMDKGIPLPELPVDPKPNPASRDPREILMHGIVWLALGLGAVASFLTMGQESFLHNAWPLPMPFMFLGAGLILFYVLASRNR